MSSNITPKETKFILFMPGIVVDSRMTPKFRFSFQRVGIPKKPDSSFKLLNQVTLPSGRRQKFFNLSTGG